MKLKQLNRLVVRVAGLAMAISLVLCPVLPGVDVIDARPWVDTDLMLVDEPLEILPEYSQVSASVVANGYKTAVLPVNNLAPANTHPLAQEPLLKPKHVLGASIVPVSPSGSALRASPPPDYSGANVPALIVSAATQYGVSADIMIKIAQCESGLRPGAVNGPFAGIFQFISGTWVSNRNAMGLDPDLNLRFNPEEAAKTAAFKMSRDGYGAWPACSKKALASN